MSIEAMKQALEALNLARAAHGQMLLSDPPQEAWKAWNVNSVTRIAMDTLRQAIEQAEKQEPVAIVSGYYGGQCVVLPTNPARLFNSGTAFYTTPQPQREWVGLTDEEIKHIEETTTCLQNESWLRNLTRNLEAKLKEKNT